MSVKLLVSLIKEHNVLGVRNKDFAQYEQTFEHNICLNGPGIPGIAVAWCDSKFGEENWDWWFKVQREYKFPDKDVIAYASFKNEKDALDFWVWWLQNENDKEYIEP